MRPVPFSPSSLFVFAVLLMVLPATPKPALAYGEGTEELPSWEERAVHLFTDRLRVEPGADDPEFASYDAVRPLMYNSDLNEAARFYAEDMAEHGCFPADHSSCDGTSFGERLAGFYQNSYIGENIALGSADAQSVVNSGWLYSPPHRDNMLNSLWLELGTGFALAEGSTPYWVQDFGGGHSIDEPITTSGVHWPLRPAAGASATFYLAIYDPDGEPNGADFVVDGECRDMAHDRGSGKQQTYIGTTSVGDSGCIPYYFVLTQLTGSRVTYPTEGAFLMPVGGADCTIWTAQRESLECNPEEDRPVMAGEGLGCSADPEADGPGSNVGNSTGYSSCDSAEGVVSAVPSMMLMLVIGGGLRRRERRPISRPSDEQSCRLSSKES